MRMFVALYPDDAARVDLTARVAELQPDPLFANMRWIPPERWHITLAFLASVDPSRIDRLQASLADVAAHHAPLDGLHLTGCGTVGATAWIGVTPTGRGCATEKLAKATQRAARSCGIEVERRAWRAHLSIARVRGDKIQVREAMRHLTGALAAYRGPVWTAESITLVNSKLDPHPQHIPVGTFTLGA